MTQTDPSLTVTWLGTATLLFTYKEFKLLFDPFVELPQAEHPNSLEEFLDADAICITHGHFDHLANITEITQSRSVPVFTTKTPTETLRRHGARMTHVHTIAAGDSFCAGPFLITAFQGRHVKFDTQLLVETLNPLHLLTAQHNVPKLTVENHEFPEAGEILVYELEVSNKKVLVMGSLGLDDDTQYPTNSDVLMLPYQGHSNLPAKAKPIIERINPKRIILTHFDNSFPPLSSSVNTQGFNELMSESFPQISWTKPEFRKRLVL